MKLKSGFCAMIWVMILTLSFHCSDRYPLISPDDVLLRQPLETFEAMTVTDYRGIKREIIDMSRHPKIVLHWVNTMMSSTWDRNGILENVGETREYRLNFFVSIFTLPRDIFLNPVLVNGRASRTMTIRSTASIHRQQW
jgi:hypothetical protein